MTTIDLYRKHKAGEISREKFLYEVRRNEQLPWITNLTSYDDAVKILKNKGVVTEAKIEEVFALTPAEESTLEKIVAKYIEDADDISKEMDAYYSKGFLGFSDMLQSNLKRDNEYTSWTQRTHDEKQLDKEIGESTLNEDWGSSDQATFNSAIHKDLGNPEKMPMPFDPKFEAAVADAVDFWWDEWDEYREDRDGLIDHAKRAYYRSYFPEEFKGFMEMFSETLNEGKKADKPKKETKTKTVDNVNPYEYRHGLTYELEQSDNYSADGLEKAIDKVLKNLTKDATFYSTLLNQKQSSFEFKPTQTDAKGMQANADGTLKKGAGKLEKANVKDNLGKKEAGKSNPKGVKTMPDKGVTGTQKTIKEGLFNEEGGNIKIEKQSDGKYYWTFTSKSGKTNKSYDGFDTSAEAQKDFMYRSKYLKEDTEDEFMDSILDILVKENILTQDDIDKLNNGEYPELLNTLYAEFDKYKHYNRTGLSISSSDLYTSAKHIAQKLGKINEGLKVTQDDDQIEISADSGDYSGFIEDDGTVSFSVIRDGKDFNDDNWKDILGADHAFVKIIDSIGGKVEALDDYVQITVDTNKLLGSNLKEEETVYNLDGLKNNKYISFEKDEAGEYPILDYKACEAYLKSVISSRYLKDVDTFMNDEEGWGNAADYFFEGEGETQTEENVEDYLEQEMSYYLFSSPDEFPRKSIKEEVDVNFEENNETQFEDLMKKYDWYYEMSDDSSKFNAGRSIDKQLQNLGSKIGGNKAVEIFNKYAPADRKVTSTFFTINESEVKVDKHSKLKELLKDKLKATLKKKVTSEDKISDENAKKSAIQTEKAKLIALNKQKQELQADTTKAPVVKTSEKNALDLKIRAATDSLNKLNQGKISVV